MARHRPHERPNRDQEESPMPPPSALSSSTISNEQSQLRQLITSRLSDATHVPSQEGPPRGDEEAKREFYRDLVRLKAQRYSHKECATILNVSERSIVNYLSDPLYKEIHTDMISDAKNRGHFIISEVIDDALGTLYQIMQQDKSGFVRFKAAEALLNYAGYNMPREEAHSDAREGVTKFLAEVEARKQQAARQTIVQVNITNGEGREHGSAPSTVTIDGTLVEQQNQEPQEEKSVYHRMVLPGGKLPPLPFAPQRAPDPATLLKGNRQDSVPALDFDEQTS